MTTEDRFEVLAGGASIEEREERLTEGADDLSVRRPSIFAHQRFVLTVAAVLMVLGLSLILLGWIGAAHSTLIEEQVPYLISGGLLGLVLVIAGGFCYFGFFLARILSTNREMLDALLRLEDRVDAIEARAPVATFGRSVVQATTERPDVGRERPLRAGDA